MLLFDLRQQINPNDLRRDPARSAGPIRPPRIAATKRSTRRILRAGSCLIAASISVMPIVRTSNNCPFTSIYSAVRAESNPRRLFARFRCSRGVGIRPPLHCLLEGGLKPILELEPRARPARLPNRHTAGRARRGRHAIAEVGPFCRKGLMQPEPDGLGGYANGMRSVLLVRRATIASQVAAIL